MRVRSLSLIALAALWCCHSLPDSGKQALAVLDEVEAIDLAGIDAVDPEILRPVRDYIGSCRDSTATMKLWYYLGRIQFNRKEYAESAVSFEKAGRMAAALGDRHYEGLVYRSMAGIHNRTMNAREDSVCLLKAVRSFQAAGDTLHAAEAGLRLAMAFYNDRKWEKAQARFDSTGPSALADSRLEPYFRMCYGSFLLDARPEEGAAEALACLEDALSLGPAFPADKWVDLGYALYLTGRRDRALSLWDSLERAAPEGLVALDYRRYCVSRRERRWGEALVRLERCMVRQDSLFRAQASALVSRSQRDYLEAVADKERLDRERERNRKRSAVAGGLLTIALLVLSGVVIVQEEKAKRLKDRQALADAQRLLERSKRVEQQHVNRIRSLRRDARDARETLEEIRSDYLFMLRSGYQRLGCLFEARHFAIMQRETESVLCQKVADILKEIDGDRKGFLKLRKFIEDNLDKPISRLLTDIPDLKEVDIQFFCYLVIGYDASLISLLMGIDNLNTVYSRKNRLLGRIRKLPPAKARRYLDLVA